VRGGKNVSAAQVEDEVATHPAVALCAAVAMPDATFGERVCVFAELRPGHDTLTLEALNDGNRRGLRLVFADEGPGIADIERAMKDGFTTGSGLGLGLGGAKRLSSEFAIDSRPGVGTRVTIVRWK